MQNKGKYSWHETDLTKEESKLIEIIRKLGWGEVINIKVKCGRPVMVTTVKDIKLD